jgi:hypothetical protein
MPASTESQLNELAFSPCPADLHFASIEDRMQKIWELNEGMLSARTAARAAAGGGGKTADRGRLWEERKDGVATR